MANPSTSNHQPSADPRTAPVSLAKADAEIVWNKRYFRLGVWAAQLIGGQSFVRWSDPANGDPITDIEGARTLLGYAHGQADANGIIGATPNHPEDTGGPVLIIGLNVVEAFRRHPLLLQRARFLSPQVVTPDALERIFGLKRLVTAATVFNAGWSENMEAAVDPNSALLLRASLKEGRSGIIDEGMGSSWKMIGPKHGVFFHRCVG